MLLLSLFSVPFPWSDQLWYFSVAVTRLSLWLRHSLTVLSLFYSCCRLSLLVLPPFWLVLFLCRLLAFMCWSNTLSRLSLSLCLLFVRLVLSAISWVGVYSSFGADPYYLAVVGSHCRFSVFPVRPCVMTEYWPIRAFLLP